MTQESIRGREEDDKEQQTESDTKQKKTQPKPNIWPKHVQNKNRMKKAQFEVESKT